MTYKIVFGMFSWAWASDGLGLGDIPKKGPYVCWAFSGEIQGRFGRQGFLANREERGFELVLIGLMASQLLAELESLILAQNERWRQA